MEPWVGWLLLWRQARQAKTLRIAQRSHAHANITTHVHTQPYAQTQTHAHILRTYHPPPLSSPTR
eukprot:1617322-Amphidinium_carterae.1